LFIGASYLVNNQYQQNISASNQLVDSNHSFQLSQPISLNGVTSRPNIGSNPHKYCPNLPKLRQDYIPLNKCPKNVPNNGFFPIFQKKEELKKETEKPIEPKENIVNQVNLDSELNGLGACHADNTTSKGQNVFSSSSSRKNFKTGDEPILDNEGKKIINQPQLTPNNMQTDKDEKKEITSLPVANNENPNPLVQQELSTDSILPGSLDKSLIKREQEDSPIINSLEEFYEILGVSPAASQKEIRKIFHKLSLQFHPDKNKDPQAEEIFKKISDLYTKTIEQMNRPEDKREEEAELRPNKQFFFEEPVAFSSEEQDIINEEI